MVPSSSLLESQRSDVYKPIKRVVYRGADETTMFQLVQISTRADSDFLLVKAGKNVSPGTSRFVV